MPDPAAAATYTIGRDKDCDVPIADDSVSRVHAELTVLEGGRLLLADRASSNGTSVIQAGRARRIDQTYVSPSDRVQFGSVEFTVSELIEAIQAKASKAAGPITLKEALKPVTRQSWMWLTAKVIKGRWKEATLVVLVLAAAALLYDGDPQSSFFKFAIGILGSVIASLVLSLLNRFWDKDKK